MILQNRARALGVSLHFETDITDLIPHADADLIVGADGLNSIIREVYEDKFKPSFKWRRNQFVWLGTTKPHAAFTFDFAENAHGIWVLGAYQYNDDLSTWIVEAPEPTWAVCSSVL